ncbi:ABC transporter permease, partial [Pseudomonas syringae pv. tagetis]
LTESGQVEATHGVSIETKLAESLNIRLGDRLGFIVGGLTREAVVTSLRDVKSETYQPNIFKIFQPGTLADQPTTYQP